MAGIDVSLLRGTDGVTERDNTDKAPAFNWQNELKNKPLFNFAAEQPNYNVQNQGACIW